MLGSLKQLQGSLIPLIAPDFCTAKGFPGAVQITWAEVPGADSYFVFESLIKGYNGILLQPVVANKGGAKNSYLRVGLLDTNTRYYYVIPVGPNGIQGTPSPIAIGTPSGIPVSSGFPIDVLSNGVFGRPLSSALSPNGEIDCTSLGVINGGSCLAGTYSGSPIDNSTILTNTPVPGVEVQGNFGWARGGEGSQCKAVLAIFTSSLTNDTASGSVIFNIFDNGVSIGGDIVFYFPPAIGVGANFVGMNAFLSCGDVHDLTIQWRKGTGIATLITCQMVVLSAPNG